MKFDKELDLVANNVEKESLEVIIKNIPSTLVSRINKWRFGSYGWTSPVNIILTCAWYKWLNPLQDTCKIWAQDHKGNKIEDGFPLRTLDEKYTVRIVAKLRISKNFCSSNSGMQGTRAIEKMRGIGRIDRDTPLEQSVKFDMKLFQEILNDIDDCSAEEAKNVFKLLLKRGLQKRAEREASLKNLNSKNSKYCLPEDILDFASSLQDPQFYKAISVVVMTEIVNSNIKLSGLTINGVAGAKTAADARARSAGDFWFEDENGESFVAVEVKDSTKKIGFDILAAIESRKENCPSIRNYFLISAAREAVATRDLHDPAWMKAISDMREIGLNVLIYPLHELFSLSCLNAEFISKFSSDLNKVLPEIDDLKQGTIEKWLAFSQ